MRISCIIPTRDRCAMVLESIASVFAQELAADEIIVVDDGSRDTTGPTITALYPQLQLITLSGLGPGLARNAGAAAASGDILMFLDSDDRWLPHHTRSLARVIQQGFSVAYGITRTQDQKSRKTFFIPGHGEEYSGECYQALTRWCFLVPSAVAITRDAFTITGGFGTEAFGEDWAFFLRLASRYPFGFASNAGPIAERILHPGSICARTSRTQLLAMVHRQIHLVKKTGGTTGCCATLNQMAEWLDTVNRENISVQEWYSAMKKEQILS